jgi:hypothetical protein
MKALITLAFVVLTAVFSIAASEAVLPFESLAGVKTPAMPSCKIDGFVFGKLKTLGIQPANSCSDAVFVRRVFLDVIGTLPTEEEVTGFLNDKNPAKRAALIDRLLERDEFGDYLGMKWCDLLRVKSEFPVNLWPEAAQAYNHWIRTSIRKNIPYSLFASEILTANGSNFRVPQVNFYRSAGSKDAKAMARAVALAFMGERTERWNKAKLDAMAAFFSQIGFKGTDEWKEEIVYWNGFAGDRPASTPAILPDGTSVSLPRDKDPREVFAHWLISSRNSPFARNAVNRTWFFLFGRGIIHEPDDSRPDNPPSNPELLAWLAQELVSANYDMKHIYRLILNSNTYQLSCIPATTDPRGAANFAFYPMRRIEAEVLIDAIDQITGSTEEYSSLTPEPYTFVPPSQRSIALEDASINSAFLDLFGRSPRDTGLLSERPERANSAQRLHLLNSSHIQSKITKSQRLAEIMRSGVTHMEMVTRLYLNILSRYPTGDELNAFKAYSGTAETKGPALLVDLAWALMNTSEFFYQH